MDEIVRVISEELGKLPMDALVGEVLVVLEQLRYYERRAAALLRPRRVGKPLIFFSGMRFREIREPHGVVLAFAPWNYPMQLSLLPMATALFAGNAVLLKCSEHAPRTALLIEELCAAARLPEGLVQVSFEKADEAAKLLEAGVDFIFFTGSSHNGRIVAARAGELMIPAVMELGGKDAALVFESSDIERTARGIAYGSFSNAGQVCFGIKRIYVQRTIYDQFLRAFLERVAELRVGLSTECDYGTVFGAVRHRLRGQVEDALARGAQLHTAWRSDAEEIMPIVLSNVPEDAELLTEESFGPVVCIAPFDSEADALEKANASEFCLGASVWTRRKEQGERVALRLQCGVCGINDVIRGTGNPEAAFGGNKASGFGRYHGAEGLKTFSRVKTLMIARRLRRSEVHWFPFKERTFARVRSLLRLRHDGTLADKLRALKGMWVLLVLLGCGTSVGEKPRAGSAEASLVTEVTLQYQAGGEIANLVSSSPDGRPEVSPGESMSIALVE
jgi:4,4'-diapolycopenoate synthase